MKPIFGNFSEGRGAFWFLSSFAIKFSKMSLNGYLTISPHTEEYGSASYAGMESSIVIQLFATSQTDSLVHERYEFRKEGNANGYQHPTLTAAMFHR